MELPRSRDDGCSAQTSIGGRSGARAQTQTVRSKRNPARAPRSTALARPEQRCLIECDTRPSLRSHRPWVEVTRVSGAGAADTHSAKASDCAASARAARRAAGPSSARDAKPLQVVAGDIGINIGERPTEYERASDSAAVRAIPSCMRLLSSQAASPRRRDRLQRRRKGGRTATSSRSKPSASRNAPWA